MSFIGDIHIKQPWESFEEYQHRIRNVRKSQEEEELRRMYTSVGISPSMLEMSGIGGISGRDENYQEFRARIDRERFEAELQRKKQNTKKLILLL